MVVNEPAEQVVAEFHEAYFENKLDPEEYLIQRGYRVHKPIGRGIMGTAINFLSVPSLNEQATNHQVLAIDDGDFLTILDPQKGNEGKKYYVWPKAVDDSELAVELGGYNVDFFLHLEPERIKIV